MLAIGPILNVRYGPRPSHYALSLLAAAAGAAFATRQVLLHILPGDPGYGTALLGYHYYTWALIAFAVAILLISAMLLFDRQFEPGDPPQRPRPLRVARGLAGDRARGAERRLDPAAMRLRRLRRRSGGLRDAEARAVTSAILWPPSCHRLRRPHN